MNRGPEIHLTAREPWTETLAEWARTELLADPTIGGPAELARAIAHAVDRTRWLANPDHWVYDVAMRVWTELENL